MYSVDSLARAMAGEALNRLDNGGSGSGTTVDAYSKLETDNLLNAKVDDVEFAPVKALAESNEVNITYLAENKADKSEIEAVSDIVAEVEAELETKANTSDVYSKSETDTAIINKITELIANAPTDLDTLKEIADWITSHEDSASAMNTAIKQNTSDIATAQEDIANLKTADENTATEIESVKSDVQNGQKSGTTGSYNATNVWVNLARLTAQSTSAGQGGIYTGFLDIVRVSTLQSDNARGHLQITVRSGSGTTSICVAQLVSSTKKINAENIKIVCSDIQNQQVFVDLWLKLTSTWERYNAKLTSAYTAGTLKFEPWELYNRNSYETELPDTGTIYSCVDISSCKYDANGNDIAVKFADIESRIEALETALATSEEA